MFREEKMIIVFIIIVLFILFIFLNNKNESVKSEKEISLNKEISNKDYYEIKEYISKTYNLDIHEISFTLLENSYKNLIRFEIKLENDCPNINIHFDKKIEDEIISYITEKEFELQNKYKAKFFVYFSSFEQDELERIYAKLPENLNFLLKIINNQNIWIIKNVFSTRVVVFFYSNNQIQNIKEKERIERIVIEYIYSSLKKFDSNNKLKKDEINIEFDTKENFDTNYESNWYYYLL
ncbi:MAG: hypothetical protein IJZ71_09220 [Treponema sp.]|nr:hypothetical protein [Treponema sp.]